MAAGDGAHAAGGPSPRAAAALVRRVTPSGAEGPPPEALRALKRFARRSARHVQLVHHFLVGERLREPDAHVRVHAVEAAHALVLRSRKFRDLLCAGFPEFLQRTIGHRPDRPLPPPAGAAQLLRLEAVRRVGEWNAKFGRFYVPLAMAAWFLQRRLRLAPHEFDPHREERRSRAQLEREARAQQALTRQFFAIQCDFPAFVAEGRAVLAQMAAAGELVEAFLARAAWEETAAAAGGGGRPAEGLRAYGLAAAPEREEREALEARILDPDTKRVLQELRKVAAGRLRQRGLAWEQVLVQLHGDPAEGRALGRMEMLRELGDLRARLAEHTRRFDRVLESATAAERAFRDRFGADGVEEVDDGFVEFEEIDLAAFPGTSPPSAAGADGPADPWAVTERDQAAVAAAAGPSRGRRGRTPPPGAPLPPLPVMDPTVGNPNWKGKAQASAAAAAPKPEASKPGGAGRLSAERREQLLALAPKVRHGPHLDAWGQDVLASHAGMELQGHWGRFDTDAKMNRAQADQLALETSYYQPPEPAALQVCGAPLANGKGLCQRRDRRACPFHGPIVPRDLATGAPLKPEGSAACVPAGGSRPEPAAPLPTANTREQRQRDREHNRRVLLASLGDEALAASLAAAEAEGARRRPPPGEDGRPETARERLTAKVSRKAKATARFRDAQDDWNERERFPNRWEER